MMNRLGKLLVLVNLAMSLLFLALALAIFFQAIDWGWKEARKELGSRVASEIDKRSAAVVGAYRTVALLAPGLKNSQDSLAETEPFLGNNHLWYREQLKQLQSADKDIVVKEIKFNEKEGAPVVDGPKGKRRGKPVFDEPIPDITKSYASYVRDLDMKQKEIDDSDADIRKLVEEERQLTLKLNGTADKDKAGKLGLYALLEKEADAQANIYSEKEYLERLLANVQLEHDLYIGRQRQLEQTLARMKKLRGAR
ncbi:MAG: hypothetical protein FJ271_23415 [Planctomycetes bacterium]|nr:hypothetical protein [Planctomycetota bacterium]